MYNAIWVDCILRVKSQDSNKDKWKTVAMALMSVAMVFNFLLIINITQLVILKRTFYTIDLYFLSGKLKTLTEFTLRFIVPVVLINYLLIFRNDRYQKLIERYPYRDGKLFLAYFLCSIAVPVVLLWVGIIVSHAK